MLHFHPRSLTFKSIQNRLNFIAKTDYRGIRMPKNRRRTSAQKSASRDRQIGRTRLIESNTFTLRIRRLQSADDRRLAHLVSEPREHSILTSAMILQGETF